jgi:hypothetical protein
VAVAQSVKLACGLKATEFVLFCVEFAGKCHLKPFDLGVGERERLNLRAPMQYSAQQIVSR